MKTTHAQLIGRFFAVVALSAPVVLPGQTVPATPGSVPAQTDQPPVVLSPFEVSTDRDRGYVATSTLAGTRMNAELWDTPASISVLTTEFLDDIGVLDVKAALDYMMNTSEDTSDYTGQSQASNDINVQIRGFVGAAAENYRNWESLGAAISQTFGQAGGGLSPVTSPVYVWNPFSGIGPVSWNGSRTPMAPHRRPRSPTSDRPFSTKRCIPAGPR